MGKQKSIALSTCEAELIALSEATTDVIYLRKLVSGLGERASPSPRLPPMLLLSNRVAMDTLYSGRAIRSMPMDAQRAGG